MSHVYPIEENSPIQCEVLAEVTSGVGRSWHDNLSEQLGRNASIGTNLDGGLFQDYLQENEEYGVSGFRISIKTHFDANTAITVTPKPGPDWNIIALIEALKKTRELMMQYGEGHPVIHMLVQDQQKLNHLLRQVSNREELWEYFEKNNIVPHFKQVTTPPTVENVQDAKNAEIVSDGKHPNLDKASDMQQKMQAFKDEQTAQVAEHWARIKSDLLGIEVAIIEADKLITQLASENNIKVAREGLNHQIDFSKMDVEAREINKTALKEFVALCKFRNQLSNTSLELVESWDSWRSKLWQTRPESIDLSPLTAMINKTETQVHNTFENAKKETAGLLLTLEKSFYNFLIWIGRKLGADISYYQTTHEQLLNMGAYKEGLHKPLMYYQDAQKKKQDKASKGASEPEADTDRPSP